LEHDVEELVGRRVFAGAAQDANVSVHVAIEDLPGGVRARLEARTAAGISLGRRELRAAEGECASLRRPLALVLAMLLDREDGSVRQPRRPRPRLLGGASLAALSGTLPRITPGAGLVLALDLPRRLEMRLDALYWSPVSIETEEGLGARFQAAGAALAVCPRLFGGAGPVGLSLCGGGQLGALLAVPLGLDGPSRATRLLAQSFLTLKAAFRLGDKARVESAIGPTVALSRPRFFLTRADGSSLDVHRPALFGAIFQLTLIISGR
jgi:hypothetical protein